MDSESSAAAFFLFAPMNFNNEFCAGAALVTGTAFVVGARLVTGTTTFVIAAASGAGTAFVIGATFVAGTELVDGSSARPNAAKNPVSPSAQNRTKRLMATTCDDAPTAKDQAGSITLPISASGRFASAWRNKDYSLLG